MQQGTTKAKEVTDAQTLDDGCAPVTDIGDLVVAATGKRYAAYCRGRLLLEAPADADIVPCASLTDPGTFDTLIDRYAQNHAPDTDRRALVSLWSLFYCANLVIGAAITFLELRRVLPLSLDEASLIIDRQSGTPRGFLLPHAGHVDAQADVYAGMAPVIRHHFDPLFTQLAAHTGLGRKTFWTNTSAYLSWIIHEIGQQAGSPLGDEGRLITESQAWPDGWRNPLARLVTVALTEKGEYCGNRRICCLRYAVKGVGGCGAICPVPEGRATGP
ncbi:ferric iron reductase protein FhuF [Neorhizobium galegae]|uniref:siderophore-iron reductase FhuF n=1 Tax=Neorhizobium galegae TaxID=399 RepID=UPI001AE191E6|nr:ferric iron reductase protein FhuF [Neorhizobium galegae]